MDKACELCGEPSEMDFNILVPVWEKAILVKGDICLSCFGSYPDDIAIAIALLDKRRKGE